MYRRHFIATCLLASGVGIISTTATYAATPKPATILIVGDSLSAEYGLKRGTGWAALLDQRLQTEKVNAKVVNASISGDTTSGGLSRLPAALQRERPAIVILELGANDGLRGQSPATISENLARLIELSQKAGARVLLAEMRIPPNYGPSYTQKFQAMFGDLAQRYSIALIPFLLDGVAGDPTLTQDDGIHPRAEAQQRILDNVWPTLEQALR